MKQIMMLVATTVAVAIGVVVGIRAERLAPGRNAILEVNLMPYMRNEYKDDVLLRNSLKQGGSLYMAADHEYVEFLREFDTRFEDYGTLNEDDKYNIRLAMLNWVSAKGWKLISVNRDQCQYVFAK